MELYGGMIDLQMFKTLRLNEIITQVNKCPWRRDPRMKSKSTLSSRGQGDERNQQGRLRWSGCQGRENSEKCGVSQVKRWFQERGDKKWTKMRAKNRSLNVSK